MKRSEMSEDLLDPEDALQFIGPHQALKLFVNRELKPTKPPSKSRRAGLGGPGRGGTLGGSFSSTATARHPGRSGRKAKATAGDVESEPPDRPHDSALEHGHEIDRGPALTTVTQ